METSSEGKIKNLDLTKGLTQHIINVVVEKQTRGLILQGFLQKLGYKVIINQSIYEAVQAVSQEMPHLILTEAFLTDGSCADLYEKFSSDKQLKNIPILVHILKKSREELQAANSKKFAGFLVGNIDPKALILLLQEHINSKISPFFISIEELKTEPQIEIFLEAQVMCKFSGNVVLQTNIEIDSQAFLECVPQNRNNPPCLLTEAQVVKVAGKLFNLFPEHKIKGPGLLWMKNLPDLTQPGKEMKRDVIFYHSSKEIYEEYALFFKSFGVSIHHVGLMGNMLKVLSMKVNPFQAIYFAEVPDPKEFSLWHKEYLKKVDKPKLILSTERADQASHSDVKYIKNPTSILKIVQSVKSATEDATELVKGLEKNGYMGTTVKLKAYAKLRGIDETGGIIEANFPAVVGTKFTLEHPLLTKMWGGYIPVTITHIKKIESTASRWAMRFNAISRGTSKSKYWEKVSGIVDHFLIHSRDVDPGKVSEETVQEIPAAPEEQPQEAPVVQKDEKKDEEEEVQF
jgi:CheY-like chemotaxis protein